MSDDVLIRCENVGKKFCRDLKRSLWYGVQDCVTDLVYHRRKTSVGPSDNDLPALRTGEFWANRNINFELKRGECLGLIGRNGAGKTTLLKMLNGLIKPDAGRITLRGKLGALIALGAGFNPILTGRENAYVNASVLGLSKTQIDDRIEEIIDFADLQEFADSPVRNYSSGMQVRLGFAIATVMEPDVLILDEVLAVGDAAFRHKCYSRINKCIKNSAVIFVSHTMEQVANMASRIALMSTGTSSLYENVTEGIAAYNLQNVDVGDHADESTGHIAIYPPVSKVDARLSKESMGYGEPIAWDIIVESEEDLGDCRIWIDATNELGQTVMCFDSTRQSSGCRIRRGKNQIRIEIESLVLHEGKYRWSLYLGPLGSIEFNIWAYHFHSFTVTGDHVSNWHVPYLPKCSVLKCELI